MHRHLFVLLMMGPLLLAGCSRSEGSGEVERAAANVTQAAATASTADEDLHPLPPERLQPSYLTPEVRSGRGQIRDVYLEEKNYTQFTRPHHIYEAAVSPSDRYLLVWHMDHPPRQVSVFEVASRQKLATFTPGAGGRIQWAAHDLIHHSYGAGTNTALFTVYAVDGTAQWSGFISGAALDASGRFIFTYPTLSITGESILIADIRNGDVLGQARPTNVTTVVAWTWLDGVTVRFWYETLEHTTRSIDIRLNPEQAVPWDEVDHVESL